MRYFLNFAAIAGLAIAASTGAIAATSLQTSETTSFNETFTGSFEATNSDDGKVVTKNRFLEVTGLGGNSAEAPSLIDVEGDMIVRTSSMQGGIVVKSARAPSAATGDKGYRLNVKKVTLNVDWDQTEAEEIAVTLYQTQNLYTGGGDRGLAKNKIANVQTLMLTQSDQAVPVQNYSIILRTGKTDAPFLAGDSLVIVSADASIGLTDMEYTPYHFDAASPPTQPNNCDDADMDDSTLVDIFDIEYYLETFEMCSI